MLNGTVVDLVPYSQSYVDLQHGWMNSEAGYWGSAGNRFVTTRAQSAAWYQKWHEEMAKGTSGPEFGICTKSGVPIGDLGINEYSPVHRTANIGILIGDPAYWSGGYGTDALLLLNEYLFNWLGLRKIWLETTSLNARMMGLARKTGYTLEAQQCRAMLMDGVWADMMVYGLMQEEWPGYAAMIQRIGLKEKQPQ